MRGALVALRQTAGREVPKLAKTAAAGEPCVKKKSATAAASMLVVRCIDIPALAGSGCLRDLPRRAIPGHFHVAVAGLRYLRYLSRHKTGFFGEWNTGRSPLKGALA